MTALALSLAEFGDPHRDQAPMRTLLRQCLGTRAALELEVHDQTMHLRAGPVANPADAEAPVEIAGGWRSPLLAGTAPETPGLLLPLLVHVRRLRLPASRIQTLGAPHRPVGDFVLRNLFLALSAGAPIDLDAAMPAAESRTAGTHALHLHYCTVLKWALPDAAFSDRPLGEIADLLVASAHCQVLRFDSPLLNRSAAALRTTVATAPALQPRLLAARARLLAHVA